MQKGGPLKFLTLVRGWPKQITTDFPLKIEFTCFSMGLTSDFMAKRGALKFFCGLKGPRKIFAIIYSFCIRSPLQEFVNGPLSSNTLARACKQWHVNTGKCL